MRKKSAESVNRQSARGPHYHIWEHKKGPHPALDFDYCTKCHEVKWRSARALMLEEVVR